MKIKYLFLAAMLAFCFSEMQAQWSFGIKATANKNWYNDVELNPLKKGPDSKLRQLQVSAQVYRQLGKHFSIGLEPGVVKRGTNDPFSNNYYGCFIFCGTGLDYGRFPYDHTAVFMDYIQLPLQVKYHQGLFKNKLEAYAKIGYGISYAVAGYTEAENFYLFETPQVEQIAFSKDADFKRWDNGIYAGLGFGFQMPVGTIFTEIEMYQGLKYVHEYVFIKNRSRGFSLGYRIDF